MIIPRRTRLDQLQRFNLGPSGKILARVVAAVSRGKRKIEKSFLLTDDNQKIRDAGKWPTAAGVVIKTEKTRDL